MKAVVLYESVYGNTEAVARAVAEALGPGRDVTLARFGGAPEEAVEEADLVVLGGPTHGWGMTRPAFRRRPMPRAISGWMASLCGRRNRA